MDALIETMKIMFFVILAFIIFLIVNHKQHKKNGSSGRSLWQVLSDDATKQVARQQAKANEPVHCPKCGSTQIASSSKGFSTGKAVVGTVIGGIPGTIIGGKIGSKKVIITCLKCGKQWSP